MAKSELTQQLAVTPIVELEDAIRELNAADFEKVAQAVENVQMFRIPANLTKP